MEDLFRQEEEVKAVKAPTAASPLAARMRPRSLAEFVGQQHILAPGKLLRRAIEADRLPSVIL
ncbi:MAG: replication-associated recombination protein A, partial [Chthoniobacterales bacterium]